MRQGDRLPAGELELRPAPGGTRLRLRVKAGAARDALVGVHAGALRVGVTAAPERGKANRAVLALIGRALGVAPSLLTLVAGTLSPDKTVVVPLDPDELRRRLAAADGF